MGQASTSLAWAVSLSGMIALAWCGLLAFAHIQARAETRLVARAARAVPVCCPIALLLGHKAATQLWASEGKQDPFPPAQSSVEAGLWALPLLAFIATFLYGMGLFVRSPPTAVWRTKGRVHFACLACGGWLVTLLFYYVQIVGGSPVVRSPVWGNRVVPLRYLLEPVAASPSITALYLCTDPVLAGTATARQQRAIAFYRTLLFQCLMMTLASIITFGPAPGSNVAVAAYALGYACTWCVFYCNIATLYGWLSATAQAPHLISDAAATFRWLAKYIVLIWHLHPFAWTLAACGLISELSEHLVWFMADLLSKSVPLLVLTHFATIPCLGS